MVTRLSLLNNNNRKMSDYSMKENQSLFLSPHHRTFLSLYDRDYYGDMLSDNTIINSLVYYVSDTRRMLCGYDFIDKDENCYG